jgi:hypothetical protein
MAAENRLWGAPRIHGELLKLGIAVSERTVSRYLANTRIAPSQTWRTFLANHFDQLAVTSPVIFCRGRDEDTDIDSCGPPPPRRGSVSGERSDVCDQWSTVPRHLPPQPTPVDRRIGQVHVHHRRWERCSSGNDPPEAQVVAFAGRIIGGDSIRPEPAAFGAWRRAPVQYLRGRRCLDTSSVLSVASRRH